MCSVTIGPCGVAEHMEKPNGMISANNKPELVYNGTQYASNEEIEFQMFLDECAKRGMLESQRYEPVSYLIFPEAKRHELKKLKTKPDRLEEKSFLRSHSYTPDWEVVFTPEFFRVFGDRHKLWLLDPDDDSGKTRALGSKGFAGKRGYCAIDVKGSWNPHGGDRIFPIHQKAMWYFYGVPVNKLIPSEFFVRMGVVPDGVKWKKNTKSRVPKKAYMWTPTFGDL